MAGECGGAAPFGCRAPGCAVCVSRAPEAEQISNGFLLLVARFAKAPVPNSLVVPHCSGARWTSVGRQGKPRNRTPFMRLHVLPCPWPQHIRRPRHALFLSPVRAARSSRGGRETCRSGLCRGMAKRALLQITGPGRRRLPAMVSGQN